MSYINQNKQATKTGMVASILLNGAIIGAIMLSPVIVKERLEPPLTIGKNIEIDQPPPPNDERMENQNDIPVVNPVFTPDPVIDTVPVRQDQISVNNIEIGAIDIGIAPAIEPVDPPKPIFHSARRDDRYARNFQPDYPLNLLQRGVEGYVRVKVLIDITGRVREVIILEASEKEFGRATQRKALSSWRFTPATRGGAKVEDWQILTVRFTID